VLAIALAVTAAIAWGFSAVLVRMALPYMATGLGTLASLVAGLLLTGLLVAALEPAALRDLSAPTLLLFALIGTLNFPVGRYCNYLAMSRLGVGRSTPLLASSPLFAVLVAVAFTGERLELATAAGIALILAGLYVTLTAPGTQRGDRN
jgi:drug/metabolite transporter (DMT)-like permease